MANPEVTLPDKEAIQQQEEALEKKNKWMYPVLITVLTLIFAAGFIYGIQLVLNMEGAFPPVILTEGKTKAPGTNAEVLAYLNDVVQTALDEKPAAASEWKFRVNGDTISCGGSEALQKTLSFLADPAEDYLSGCVEKQAVGFGGDFGGVLSLPEITESDIESFTCDYIYYSCRNCGVQSAEPVEACENCGSDRPYDMHYRDQYTVTVELVNTPELAQRLFHPQPEDVEAAVSPVLAGYAQLEDVTSENKRLCISFVTDRATDELKTLVYRKEAAVSAAVRFAGDYASLGSADCGADISEETLYSFTWPAAELNKHTLTMAPGKKEQLTAERICDDPKAYEITWTSSDESVVTVDQKGYVKACKKLGDQPGKATVTASFVFNGKTYSDSCEITVKVSVEYIQINKHNLTLRTGETETLKARVASDNKGFAMEKPTVQTVSWFTTDESVATVDKNGSVTAVGPGTCTVYALSDDEYYRASCEVTVKE